MNTTDRISEGLFNLLINAKDADSAPLYETVERLRNTYGVTYRALKRIPFAKAVIEAIEEAARYEGREAA